MTQRMSPEQRARGLYLKRSNIPSTVEDRPLSDFTYIRQIGRCQDFLDNCMDQGGNSPGVGLVIFGTKGTGKTTLGVSLLRTVLATANRKWLGDGHYYAYYPGYFIRHTRFMRTHYASFRDDEEAAEARELLRSLYFEAKECYMRTRVLVLDDAGKENPDVGTGHKAQVMGDILRERYAEGAPTIVTTNLQMGEWPIVYGEATASFLADAFRTVDANGPDRRG